MLRAKLRVIEVKPTSDTVGTQLSEQVKLTAVYDANPESENAQWSKWTPFAAFEMSITNPAAFGKLPTGHEFYVDFTPAEG